MLVLVVLRATNPPLYTIIRRCSRTCRFYVLLIRRYTLQCCHAENRRDGVHRSQQHFLRLLLDKKYALPFRVLDALVAHFLSFRTDKQTLPVLWHQSLLTLVQRYKADLSSEQKEALLELLKCQTHVKISSEIRRELQNAASRDLEDATPTVIIDWR